MPTQEEINAANVELQIANDNYARMADRYNKYNRAFEIFSNASPDTQEKAKGLMQEALAEFNQLKLDMLAAEDRIAVAQNKVNNLNTIIATQRAQAAAPWTRRKTVVPETPIIVPQPDVNPNPTPNTNGRNPYLSLYNLYAQEIAENWNPSEIFTNLRVSPQQVTNWLLDAWLTLQQASDFMNDWQKYRPDVNLTSNQWTNTVPRRKLNTWGSGNGTLI